VATAFQPNAFQTGAFQIDGGASFGDGALSATGTGTATFVGESTAVAPFSVTGTGTATFVGAATASSVLAATATGTGLFTGASFASGVLSATGTGTADFVGLEISTTGALAATGTVTASFAGDYDAFNCGLVLNDGTSYVLLNDGNSALLLNDDSCLAPPPSTGTLSVTGTGTASFVGDFDTAYNCGLLLNDGAFVLLNDGTSVVLLNDATCLVPPSPTTDTVLDAGGSGAASFVGAFDSAAVEPPVAGGGGVAAPGAWRVRKKKQKKKDELDDLIAQLKEQIVPYREAQEVGAQIMLRAELEHALTISLEGTLNEIESEIAALKEVLAEMDDEEALLLLM
jgi:hypothetical protein